jgi:hypothetical protein
MAEFDWTQLINPAVQTLGAGYVANNTANNATTSANNAAQMSQFRPVGVTSRFGSSGFQYGPNGQLTGAGYQVAPDIAAQREGLIGMAGTGLSQAQQQQAFQPQVTTAGQGLFNLGQQYVAQTPQGAAQNWMTQQQGLLAPGREQQLAQLTNQQQQQGRLGLATGATSAGYGAGSQGLQAANPQMAAYYNAQAQQDAQLSANAQQAGQAQTTFGQGLMTGGLGLTSAGYNAQNAALTPYTNLISGASNAENLGSNALTLGRSFGSDSAASNDAAARQYMAGQNTANQNQQATLQGALKGFSDPISQLINSLAGGSSAQRNPVYDSYGLNVAGYR